MEHTRRRTLRRCGLALGVGLAGCLGDDGDPTATSDPRVTDGESADAGSTEQPHPAGSTATPARSTPATTPSATGTPTPHDGTAPDDGTTATPTPTQAGVAWRFDLNAAVEAAPAVADGTVYVGGWRRTGGTPTPGGDGSGGPSTALRALSVDTGREQWRLDVGAPVQARPRVVDDRVYVVRGFGGLHGHRHQVRAVSTDGRALWRHEAQSLKFLRALGADETGVVVGEHDDNLGEGNERVTALAPDGTVDFQREVTDVYDGSVDEETVYVADYRRRVRALDRAGGDVRWTAELESNLRWPTVLDDQVIGAASAVVSLDRADGSVRWSFGEGTPIGLFVDEGRAFVLTDDGRAFALDASDGSRVWSLDVGDDRASSAVGDEAVYVSRENGTLSAHDRSSGGRLWEVDLGDRAGIRPAGDRVYAVRGSEVIALDAADGGRVGSVTVDGDARWLVSGETDVLVTSDGIVYGLTL